jgi:hypothetical protein
MTRHVYLIVTALFSGACRFGGPDDDVPILLDVDAGQLVKQADSNDGAATLDARAPDRGTADAQPPASDSAAGDAGAGDSAADDSATDSAAGDSGSSDSGAAVQDAAMSAQDGATQARPDASVASCDPPADLACDPVSGEGCLLFMQCLADPGSSAPAAYCVFGGLQLEMTCTEDALSTDCPPLHTCVMGHCRKYCYCDADCDSGAACVDPSGAGSTRFRVCGQTSSP